MVKAQKSRRRSSRNASMQANPLFGLLLGLIVIGGVFTGVYFGGKQIGWWAASDDDETPTTVEETGLFEFYGYNPLTQEEYDDDDLDFEVYESPDKTDYTQDQIDDWTASEYTLDATKDSGDTYTYSDDHDYYVIATGTDVVPDWFIPIDSSIGKNSRPVYNLTEDVALAMVSMDEMSTSFVNTSYDRWQAITQTLDGAEGTGDATDDEAFAPYCNFTNAGTSFRDNPDNNVFIVLRIELNTSADLSYVEYDPDNNYPMHSINKHVSGNYIYYEIEGEVLAGQNTFEFEFSSGLGTTYEAESCAIGYNTAASMNVWDTAT